MTAYRMAPDATSETGIAGAPSRSAGNRNTISTANATTMPTSARSPRQRATATITTANVAARIASGQRPLEVEERVRRRPVLVDLPADPDVVADGEARLARVRR